MLAPSVSVMLAEFFRSGGRATAHRVHEVHLRASRRSLGSVRKSWAVILQRVA